MKTALTLECILCMVERIEIMHRMDENRVLVINDNSDRFSTCTCFFDFHCFKIKKSNSDAEDGSIPEKSKEKSPIQDKKEEIYTEN